MNYMYLYNDPALVLVYLHTCIHIDRDELTMLRMQRTIHVGLQGDDEGRQLHPFVMEMGAFL